MIETPFATLSPAASRALVDASRLKDLDSGGVVFEEGELGGSLFLVASGVVAVQVSDGSGDLVTVAIRGPGELLGEMALFAKATRRTATATARSRSRLLELDAESCAQVRRAHSELDDLFLRILAERSATLSHLLAQRIDVPAEARVAGSLMGLPPVGDECTALPVTVRDVAGLSGLTVQDAEQALVELQEKSVVDLDGGIRILDRSALDAIASVP